MTFLNISPNKPLNKPSFVFGIMILVVIGYFAYRDIKDYMDVILWDEGEYLKNGLLFMKKIPKTWGPLYSGWYFVLHLLEHDTLQLYFLNYRILSVLPIVLFFCFLQLRGIHFSVSLLISMSWMLSSINIAVWPMISHLCISIVLLGCILGSFFNKQSLKYLVFTMTALFVSYARPEYYFSFIVLFIVCILFCWKERKQITSLNKYSIVIGMLMVVLVHKVMGISILQDKRGLLALTQHFMYNYNLWHHINEPWWICWYDRLNEIFNHPKSILHAFNDHPDMFHKHVYSNVVNYIILVWKKIGGIILFSTIFKVHGLLKMIVVGLVVLMSFLVGKHLNVKFSLRKNVRKFASVWLLLFMFVFPSLISSIIVFPREHYFVLQIPFILFVMLSVLDFQIPPNRFYKSLVIIFSICILLFGPNAKNFKYFNLFNLKDEGAYVKDVIIYLKDADIKEEVNLLENEGGITYLLTPNYTWCRGFGDAESWNAFQKEKNINMIYVSSFLEQNRFKLDDSWSEFIQNPEQHGFVKIKTGRYEPYLLMSKELYATIDHKRIKK